METKRVISSIKFIFWLIFDSSKVFSKLQKEKWYIKPHINWINSLNIKKKDKVLEIGTGTGELAIYAQKKSNCNLIGIDNSSKMLMRVKKSKVKFILSNAENLRFKNNHFDLIFSSSLLNITSNPEKIISEAFRVSKNHSKISFLIPSKKMNIINAKIYIKKNKLKGFSKSALLFWAKNKKLISKEKIRNIFDSISNNYKFQEKYFFEGMLVSYTFERI